MSIRVTQLDNGLRVASDRVVVQARQASACGSTEAHATKARRKMA